MDFYSANPYDECVFVKNDDGKNESVVLVYVDDLMILSDNQTMTNDLIRHLTLTYKDIKYKHGNNHSYLGMNFKFYDDRLEISMKGYIDNILRESNVSGVSDCPSSLTLLQFDDSEPILKKSDQKRIHRATAQLLYLSPRTRPDIALVVNSLSRRVNKYIQSDDRKLRKCLNYLNTTSDLGLILRVDPTDGIRITCHADTSLGINPDDRKSQGAHVFTLGNG